MHTNRLAREKSPYLLQHAHNPVDWYPWGDEAFAKARAEDKPVFLSIGYSTCHWCHVMERESFENERIATLLNRDFVSIKVDREERPDVDRLYMAFVQATTGSGGWPMSVWLTPERRPFYGGTYFPPESRYHRPGFAHVLEQIARGWREQRQRLIDSSFAIVKELGRQEGYTAAGQPALDATFNYFRRVFDKRYGGFGGAPKFPRPSVFHFLFRYYAATGQGEAAEMALFTLREMARGGMYDQLGGGFHRYSVDEIWRVPHYEKMLYDQAQLATAYCEAHRLTQDARYAGVARGIFEYVLRDLTSPEGAFYSAEDADSEGEEGTFYTWSRDELDAELPVPLNQQAADHYGVSTAKDVIYEATPGVPEEIRRRLFAARAQRPRPHRDDKVLTSWNALMISAFCHGAQTLGEPRYREAAERAMRFVLREMYNPGDQRLLRRWREGEAAIDAFLDDYASLLNAMVDLYETTFETAWLELALPLARQMVGRFADREQGGFFSTADHAADLVLRLKDDYDGAEPGGNSLAAMALLRLSRLTGGDEMRQSAESALQIKQGPEAPYLLSALLLAREPKEQAVIVGPEPEPFLKVLHAQFRPFETLIVLRDDDARARFAQWLPATAAMPPVAGKTAAYLCRDFTCQAPVTDPSLLAPG